MPRCARVGTELAPGRTVNATQTIATTNIRCFFMLRSIEGRDAADASQTRIDFHPPRRNSSALTTDRTEKLMAIDQNTPAVPKPSGRASRYARGTSPSQKQPRLMSVGVVVSPAPL